MLLWRTYENYPSVIIKYPPYLFYSEEWAETLLNDIETDISVRKNVFYVLMVLERVLFQTLKKVF